MLFSLSNSKEPWEIKKSELGGARGEYFPENCKLFPNKNDQKRVTFPNLLSKLSKKRKLFLDEYPQIREGFKKKQVQDFGHCPKSSVPPTPPSKVWTSLISFINLKLDSSQNASVSCLARNVE